MNPGWHCTCAIHAVDGMAYVTNSAKPQIGLGWGLVSRIGSIETHRMARETPGRALSARLLCTVHVSRVHVGRACYTQMLVPAKPHIGRGWGLVSRIGHIETHRMALRNRGASEGALAMQGTCRQGTLMLAQAKPSTGQGWDLVSGSCCIKTH